jgi:hypothetical protein
VNCNWGNWNPMSQCSKTCGGGQQSRTRIKLNEASNGGMSCQGGMTENKACNAQGCPAKKCCAFGVFCVLKGPCLG